jgi:hypothetical protein
MEPAPAQRAAEESNLRRWRLAPRAYWRREGSDLILVNETTLLRLNGASARIFAFLLGSSKSTAASESEIASLQELLSAEALIEPADEVDSPLPPPVPHISYPQSADGPDLKGFLAAGA